MINLIIKKRNKEIIIILKATIIIIIIRIFSEETIERGMVKCMFMYMNLLVIIKLITPINKAINMLNFC